MICLALLLLLSTVVSINYTLATGSQCYSSENGTDFADVCKKQYHGVKNGGRCFFLGNKAAEWAGAWSVCSAQGGTMAQIHSTGEMRAITAYLNVVAPPSGDGPYIWVANIRKQGVNPTCYLDSGAYWYINRTTYDPKMDSRNTWIYRTHHSDDCGPRYGYCNHIFNSNSQFGDNYCTAIQKPLCQVTNPAQNYTFFPTCLTELVIETPSASTLMDCAKNCDYRSWCRSFNFWNSTKLCELFPWSARDTPKKNNTAGCYHFTYDP